MNTTTKNDVLSGITCAVTIEEIEEIINAATERRREIRQAEGATKFAQLKVGDPVFMAATVRPKYLARQRGIVREKRRTKVLVDLDKPAGRFHRGVICPPDMLDFDV